MAFIIRLKFKALFLILMNLQARSSVTKILITLVKLNLKKLKAVNLALNHLFLRFIKEVRLAANLIKVTVVWKLQYDLLPIPLR